MFDLGIDGLVRRDGGGCTVLYFFLSLHKKELTRRLRCGTKDLLMYAYVVHCHVQSRRSVCRVLFLFCQMGAVQFVLSPHVLVDAMGLSALMVASVLKATGSSSLMVMSMMDGSDGRTQQSNLMVVGKIGGGIRWFRS